MIIFLLFYSGLRTVFVLDNESCPAVLQSCHPRGESRWFIILLFIIFILFQFDTYVYAPKVNSMLFTSFYITVKRLHTTVFILSKSTQVFFLRYFFKQNIAAYFIYLKMKTSSIDIGVLITLNIILCWVFIYLFLLNLTRMFCYLFKVLFAI